LFTLMTNVARTDTHSSKCMIHEKASNLPKKTQRKKHRKDRCIAWDRVDFSGESLYCSFPLIKSGSMSACSYRRYFFYDMF
jgi:hypothetical protein